MEASVAYLVSLTHTLATYHHNDYQPLCRSAQQEFASWIDVADNCGHITPLQRKCVSQKSHFCKTWSKYNRRFHQYTHLRFI